MTSDETNFSISVGDESPIDVASPIKSGAHATRRELARIAAVRGEAVTLSQEGKPTLRVQADGTFEVLDQSSRAATALVGAAALAKDASAFLRGTEIPIAMTGSATRPNFINPKLLQSDISLQRKAAE